MINLMIYFVNYKLMKGSKQAIQQSQLLLEKKCSKCRADGNLQAQNNQILCQNCLKQSQLQKISFIRSDESNHERNQDSQRSKMTSLSPLKRHHSQEFDLKNNQTQKNKNNTGLKSYNSLIVEKDEFDSDSEEEKLKIQEEKLNQQIRKDNLKLKNSRKVIVGSGFTFDMTDFFKFKKKQIRVNQLEPSLFQAISGSPVAWVILFYTICSTALIPSWNMSIRASKLLKQCWRFLMQAIMVIPFVLHQRRTINPQIAEKYTLKYIFSPQNIIKPYVSSLASCLWFLFVTTSFQWTYVSHAIVLGGLSNFFLSIGRYLNKNNHQIQSGGQILIILGIILVLHDSVNLKVQLSSDSLSYKNTYYLKRTWWERLAADCLALFSSFMMSQFSKYTADLRNYFPPFLSLLIVNCFNVFNLILFSYFFNGTTFDSNSFWGIFGLFTESHFTSFMFMAIILAFGQLLSVFMITKMFPDPIIPAIAMTLQPYLACFFVNVANVQSLPTNFAMIGFLLILPGMMIVLIGQCIYQRQKSFQQQSDLRVKKLMDQITLLKQKKEQRLTLVELRKNSKLIKLASRQFGKKNQT